MKLNKENEKTYRVVTTHSSDALAVEDIVDNRMWDDVLREEGEDC